MTRQEVRRKLDEIIDFAGVEKFIDTPAKHYSSGMYMRLAFAVAAHLEPEILLVDEVLAVGDAEFQKKCLGKMGEVAGEGRTVLFVSHNMAALQNLCRSALLLSGGKITARGPVGETISTYLAGTSELAQYDLGARPDRQGSGEIRFRGVQLLNNQHEAVQALRCGETAVMRVLFDNSRHGELHDLQLAVGIDNHLGERVAYLGNELVGQGFKSVPAGAGAFDIVLERLPLAPGRYGFTLFATVRGAIADWVQNAGVIEVEPGDFYRTGKLPPAGQGFILLEHHFRLKSDRT
jgi:lipopolysaccharide transport system ATP-binding protein